ncbi:MAG: hypothetical protein NC900_04325 [Candidatus Omnitrophica bacterium]|nr:hypothetical protein [Candidatus Omnitrophota bacterium]
MDIEKAFGFYLILCFAIISLIIIINWKRKLNNCGLSIFYVLGLSMMHTIAPIMYILPWQVFSQKEWVLYGFRESTYALASFAIGNLVLTEIFFKNIIKRKKYIIEDKCYTWQYSRLPYIYFWMTLLLYLITAYKPIMLPSITALNVASNNFMIVCVCIICWQAYCNKNIKELNKWLLISLLFPLLTLIFSGYLGYGIGMSMLVIVFTFRFFRKFIRMIIIYLIMLYLGFSIYVTYMKERGAIREVIWRGAPITDRINVVFNTFKKIEWFDPSNPLHTTMIDSRLNQNILVGAAVEYIKNGFVSYACGSTIYESLLGFIPRILYPQKPVYAGSGDIVSRFTGIEFASGTSVGVGQVMELYINFGRIGIIIGFMIIGILIRLFDVISAHYLLESNIYKFILWFLPGIFLSNVGGSLIEVTSSIGGGIVLTYLIMKLKLERYRLILFFIFLFLILYLIRLILFS